MFAEYVKFGGVLFKYAKGMRDIKGREFHTFNEIFLLKSEKAGFTSDSCAESLYANSLVIIPKEKFHQFDPVGGDGDYCRCVFQFDNPSGLEGLINSVTGSVRIIRNISVSMQLLFEKAISLINMNNVSEEDKEILLKSVFSGILFELKYNYIADDAKSAAVTDIVSDITSYIEEHYLEKITLKSISKSLNISETLVSHKFKETMNISPYNYILKKRLTHAYNLIKGGASAFEAAVICGFGEYSGFYKMYKKYFGVSPGETKKGKY